MAKEVIWTLRSIQDRIQIFKYWEDHNKSDSYSLKLEILFQVTAELLSKNPNIGIKTNLPAVRIKIVRSFKIFYHDQNNRITILRIWDSRQNPENFKLT